MAQEFTLPVETKRLILRDFVKRDWEPVFELYRLPETSHFESWDPIDDRKRIKDQIVQTWISNQSKVPRTDFTLAVDLKGKDRFIGVCGVEIDTDTSAGSGIGEVGFRFFPDIWGQGYATEALKGLISFSFDELGLHRIWAGCVKENVASARVLEKAGMRLEGCTRKSYMIDGSWHDSLFYGILRTDDVGEN